MKMLMPSSSCSI